ncbi:hypothetical protein [Streptomyces sp. NPDC019224]|uniref:hypothetical protein n=1 Tax=Streptomyces sp. NPDC019224 TaxID=3154484 RepID=UPI0033F97A1B
MASQTNTSQTANVGWCHWHKGPSGTAVLVHVIEQGSGPGVRLYACAPCREQRGLVPASELPDAAAYRAYLIHTQRCTVCTDSSRCAEGSGLWQVYKDALAVHAF